MQEYILAIADTAFATGEKHFETLRSEETCFVSVALRKDVMPVLAGYMKEKTDKLFASLNENIKSTIMGAKRNANIMPVYTFDESFILLTSVHL